MREALADSCRTGLDGLSAASMPDPPADELQRWQNLTVTPYSSHLGADYAG